jgi:tetratricopeptide (TPR) repeat protein
MMSRRLLAVFCVLSLAGCAPLGPRPQAEAPLIKPAATADEAKGIAQDLSGRGRWSEGIATLADAAKRFPEDPTLASELEKLQARWQDERRVIEDLMLVGDAENQQNKIALLEKYSLAEPDNLIITSRRIYWRERLTAALEPLTACSEAHAATDPALSKRCFQVASAIPATEDIERRLASVDEQLRANENIAAQRRRASEARERHARAKVLLDNAKRAIEGNDYRRALDILEKVAALQPNNREVTAMQEQALSMLSPQVEALVKLGDHLYLDEQLEAAVATWQAALSLQPDDADILARIERARNVLDRLDALRRQQRPAAAQQ